MSNIFLAGKDLPDSLDFAHAVTAAGNALFTIASPDTETSEYEIQGISSTTWNKSSAISAHSLLIKAETKLETINSVILYFDSTYFAGLFPEDKIEEISTAADTMINSFNFLASELLKRSGQKKEKITVAFLLKTGVSKYENAEAKTPSSASLSTAVTIAERAFEALAQDFAVNVSERDYLSVLLAKCTPSNELYNSETELAKWLLEGIKTVENQKNRQTLKQAAVWNKAGAKIQTGFSLFR